MKRYLFLSVILFLLFPVVVNASPVTTVCVDLDKYSTGTRSTDPAIGGITAFDGWSGSGNNGFQITWDIGYDSVTELYTYEYTISGEGGAGLLSKDLSHWILEVTEDAEWGFTVTSATPSFSDSEGPKTFGDAGNPGIPGDIHGIKWNYDPAAESLTLTLETKNRPVWGDFYAKDGQQGGIWAVAYNTGFGDDPNINDDPFTDWIARPDGECVPIPGTLLLLGSGLLGVVCLRRKLKG